LLADGKHWNSGKYPRALFSGGKCRILQDEQKHWDLFAAFFPWWFHSFVKKPKLFGMIPNCSQAEELLRRALEGREKHLGPEHLDTLNSLLNLGDLLTHKRQFEEAKGNLWEPYGDREGILQ
jgi:hypothetical protein